MCNGLIEDKGGEREWEDLIQLNEEFLSIIIISLTLVEFNIT